MPQKPPRFLRNEATKSQGRPGMKNQTAMKMVADLINQVVRVFNEIIRPDAPQQTRKASASPFSDVVRGPTPPAGAVRRARREDDNDGEHD